MTTDALVTMYAAQLRGVPEMHDAPAVAEIEPVLAAVFPGRRRCFVTYQPFSMSGPDLDRLIDDVVAYAKTDDRVDQIKWKMRGHDPLPDLLGRLQRRGFTVGETETVLAGRVGDLIAVDPGLPEGYTDEHAVTEQALRDAESLAGRIFGDSPQQIREQEDELVQQWRDAPGSFEMWVVRYEEGHVVCSGRIDFVEGTDFAGPWGGACDPALGGLGLYRALVAQRARSAQARGKHLVQVDCSEDSRPILERAGLATITTVSAVIWPVPEPRQGARRSPLVQPLFPVRRPLQPRLAAFRLRVPRMRTWKANTLSGIQQAASNVWVLALRVSGTPRWSGHWHRGLVRPVSQSYRDPRAGIPACGTHAGWAGCAGESSGLVREFAHAAHGRQGDGKCRERHEGSSEDRRGVSPELVRCEPGENGSD